jgi:hypothetical protein
MVDSTGIPLNRPLQRVAGCGGGQSQAVTDPGLDLSGLFVVVPRYQLQCRQLPPRIVKAVDFRKCLQPCFSALLAHDTA